MRSIRFLSSYLIYLPLIGLMAFFLDSSFVAFRNFFPIYKEDVNRIYLINSIGCVIMVIGILYILFKMTADKVKHSRRVSILKYIFFVSQSGIIVFIIITLLQLQRDGTYSSVYIIVLLSLSYGMGLYCIALLASKFFAWFRIGREATCILLRPNDVYLYCILDYIYSVRCE